MSVGRFLTSKLDLESLSLILKVISRKSISVIRNRVFSGKPTGVPLASFKLLDHLSTVASSKMKPLYARPRCMRKNSRSKYCTCTTVSRTWQLHVIWKGGTVDVRSNVKPTVWSHAYGEVVDPTALSEKLHVSRRQAAKGAR